MVRPEAGLVAGMAALLTGAAHPAISRTVSVYLLLLSRVLLQVVLGRSAGLYRRRTAEVVPRRALLPARLPERASLLHGDRGAVPLHPGLGPVEGDVVPHRRWRDRVRP